MSHFITETHYLKFLQQCHPSVWGNQKFICKKWNKNGWGVYCFYCCYFLLFLLLDCESQEGHTAKQFSATITPKLRSKEVFSLLNKVWVRSPGVPLALFISLNWELSLNFLFRHLSPEDRGLDFIIKGETEKFWMLTTKVALHLIEIHPKGEKGSAVT